MPEITVTLTDEQAAALESGKRHPLIENTMRRLRVIEGGRLTKETLDKQTVEEFIQEFVGSIADLAVQRERIVQAQAARKATDEIPILEVKLAALKRATALKASPAEKIMSGV